VAVGLLALLGAGEPETRRVEDVQLQPVAEALTPESAAARHWQVTRPGENEAYNQRERLVAQGLLVYNQHCMGCHGVNGDGQGPAAERLIVKPRDFTAGVYKFRSTKQLQLPLEADLHRTITKGLPGASMPGFPLMSERDKVAVIEYIKTFYPAWESRAVDREVVAVPLPPADFNDPMRVARGRVVYLAMQCGSCHGTDGAGTNATVGFVEDAALGRIAPRNFTFGRFRGGTDPRDVYRTFHTGLGGAMPQFDGSVVIYVNQETVATQQTYMDEGEMQRLKAALAQFPVTAGEIFEWPAEKKEEMVTRSSWDLVAYVLSLTKNPKASAPPPTAAPAEEATSTDGAAATEGDDDYGY
jgi:cytochrome c oxidase cbb3-type subunit 2